MTARSKVVYLITSRTILIGRFSNRLKVGRFLIRGCHRQVLVSLRISLRPHRSWPRFAGHSNINRAPALLQANSRGVLIQFLDFWGGTYSRGVLIQERALIQINMVY